MPGIFKKLSAYDYQITPFKAHKAYTFSGNKTGSGVYFLEGYHMFGNFQPNDSLLEPTNSITSASDSYHYKRTVWNSVNSLYYKFAREGYKSNGPNKIKTFPFYGETLGDYGLRYQERFIGSTVAVISLPQNTYGESIKPNTVKLVDNDYNITLRDDGFGNLYEVGVNTGSAVSDKGLIGYWPFNDKDTHYYNFLETSQSCTTTTLKDKSILGSNSTKVSGSPQFISDNTKISSSAGLYFKTDDYIEGTGSLPYSPLNKDMNIRSVSFSFSGSKGGQFIQLCTDDTFETSSIKHNWRIGLKNDNKLYFDTVIQSGSQATASYSSSLSTSNTFNQGHHHCVCQISGGIKQIWMNGEKVASENVVFTEIRRKKNVADVLVESTHYIRPTMNKFGSYRFGKGYEGYLDEVRFYNRTLDSDEISTLNTHPSNQNFVGNVFYHQGLITITNREQRYKNTFRNPPENSVSYKGDITIYEHEVTCNVNKGEFNQTLNRTVRKYSDPNNENLRSALTSSQFTPYVTTIGLYDDDYNLIAIGKLAEPVRNDPDVDKTFVIRWDS